MHPRELVNPLNLAYHLGVLENAHEKHDREWS